MVAGVWGLWVCAVQVCVPYGTVCRTVPHAVPTSRTRKKSSGGSSRSASSGLSWPNVTCGLRVVVCSAGVWHVWVPAMCRRVAARVRPGCSPAFGVGESRRTPDCNNPSGRSPAPREMPANRQPPLSSVCQAACPSYQQVQRFEHGRGVAQHVVVQLAQQPYISHALLVQA